MEGALASGAVTERTAGAAGENATGDIMDNISKGNDGGREASSGINWEGRQAARRKPDHSSYRASANTSPHPVSSEISRRCLGREYTVHGLTVNYSP